MARRDPLIREFAAPAEPVEESELDPVVLDDPDRSGRPGPSATDPGIQAMGDSVTCPWCGGEQDLFLEPSGETGKETFVEECEECTREFEVFVEYDLAGAPHVHSRRT